jgi:membrane dipeptidase
MLVDHIEHIARVAGVDHVGLGSDFDGIGRAPDGLDDATDLVLIVVELRKRDWSEKDIRKFLGENHLRVIKANIGR